MEFSAALISILPHVGYSETVLVKMMSTHLGHCKLNEHLTQDQFSKGIFFETK